MKTVERRNQVMKKNSRRKVKKENPRKKTIDDVNICRAPINMLK